MLVFARFGYTISGILTIPSPGAKLRISVSILVLVMYLLALCRIRLCYSLSVSENPKSFVKNMSAFDQLYKETWA